MRKLKTYSRLLAAICGGTVACILSNQVCLSFDGLNYKLRPPACSMAAIESRLRKNPTDASALMDRALAYLTAGECELAVQDYSVVIKHNPRMAPAYLGRSRALEMIGSHSQALRDIDKAIEINDKTCLADALLHKTAVLSALNRAAESPPIWEQLINRKDLGAGPADIINMREQRATLYLRLKKPELALIDLEVCGLARPSSLDIYLNKGKAYSQLNNPEKELEILSRGIKLDNASHSMNGDRYLADLYQARANLYKKMGKSAQAEADLKQIKLHQSKFYHDVYEPNK